MEKVLNLNEWLVAQFSGDFDSKGRDIQIAAGWFDWFCNDSSLANKTKKLAVKLQQIVTLNSQSPNPKFDPAKCSVMFKNNCPMNGSLYDDFRICDIETGDVLFTITPKCGHKSSNGKANLWGHTNKFAEALVNGTWSDVKNYFKN